MDMEIAYNVGAPYLDFEMWASAKPIFPEKPGPAPIPTAIE
jgi:hypothetical protein